MSKKNARKINQSCWSIVLILILNYSCSNNEHKFYLKGHICDDFNNKVIILNQYKDYEIYKSDSTTIKNGTFYFEGDEFLDGTATIMTDNNNVSGQRLGIEIILEKGNIEIFLDSVSRVVGGDLNKIFEQFQEISFIPDSVVSTIFKNIDNPIGMILTQKYISVLPDDILTRIQDIGGEKYKHNASIKSALIERNEYIEFRKKQQESIGSLFKNLPVISSNGDVKQLSDYIDNNKYTFLHFWASWCAPCVDETPILNEIYTKYKWKGFEIISISIDENRENWLKAIEMHDIPGINLLPIDKNLCKDYYHINLIPYGIILDKNGYINDVKIGVESLDSVLVTLGLY